MISKPFFVASNATQSGYRKANNQRDDDSLIVLKRSRSGDLIGVKTREGKSAERRSIADRLQTMITPQTPRTIVPTPNSGTKWGGGGERRGEL